MKSLHTDEKKKIDKEREEARKMEKRKEKEKN